MTTNEKKGSLGTQRRSDNGLRCTRFTFLNSCRLILTAPRFYCATDLYQEATGRLSPASRVPSSIFLAFLLCSLCPRCYLNWNKNAARSKYFPALDFGNVTHLHFTKTHKNPPVATWPYVKVTRSWKKGSSFNRTLTSGELYTCESSHTRAPVSWCFYSNHGNEQRN